MNSKVKKDFPIFQTKVNGNPLVYLDSAATSQKPKVVLDTLLEYYTSYSANIRRGIYPLAEKATAKVEEARKKVQVFIGAESPEEIIFVRNTTEAINLVAYSFASHNIKEGDTILATVMEHHSNFVPWQQLVSSKAATFEVLDIDSEGFLIMDEEKIKRTAFFALTHVSNMLGTINPVKEIVRRVREINPKIIILVDAAQSVPHMPVDVLELDCDFLAFSGHKTMAGTGVGVLYGRKKLLEQMKPFLYGGEMIRKVSVRDTTFADIPEKFEAGTPAIADIISLGAAIDYLQSIGMDNVRNHEKDLLSYTLKKMEAIQDITLYGPKDIEKRGGVIAFNLSGVHPHDVAQVLGDTGICIRAGHHCTMPLHTRLGIPASARVSVSIYNDRSDIDLFLEGLEKARIMFSKKLLDIPYLHVKRKR